MATTKKTSVFPSFVKHQVRKRIYSDYLQGYSLDEISERLNYVHEFPHELNPKEVDEIIDWMNQIMQ